MAVTWQGKSYASWDEVRALEAAKVAAPAPSAAPVAVAEAVPTFELSAAAPSPAPAPAKRRALTERYRPHCLSELAGQVEAVAALTAFVANPYPAAFIMSGPTGVGKTSIAWALAGELGCDPEWGAVTSIASGEMTADTLREIWPTLWTTPFGSARGFRLLIINEIEALNGTVEKLWLDKLEDLPPKTVVVFTTNNLQSLPARFVDRCNVIEFRYSADDLSESARALAGNIWKAETGGTIPIDVLDRVIQGSTRAGQLSYRRVVQSLTPLIGQKAKMP